MKRLFTLSLMAWLLATTGAVGQNYRKWDFTKWSAQTVENLKIEATKGVTGGSWSDVEKASATEPTEASRNNCFWLYDSSMTTLTANGQEIAETAGLEFNGSYAGNRSLAIAVNYPETSLGTYAGPSYLWLGGKEKTCFTIPKVRVGQKIVIVAESHKPTDARGVALYIGSVGDANKIGDSFTPTTQDTYTWEGWTLPEGAATNDDGTVNIVVYNTNGCHLYSIEVGDNSQKSKIAYLYEGTPDDNEKWVATIPNYETMSLNTVNKVAVSAEALRSYDAVVVASNVTGINGWADLLKASFGWTPIVNTSYSLYEAWGMGKPVNTEQWLIRLTAPANALFNAIDKIEEDGITAIETATDVYGISALDPYFADDDVLAVGLFDETLPTIHIHNLGHNAYIYVPGGNTFLVVNAVKAAANSKAAVVAAPKPTISFAYGNMTTQVSISSSVPGAKIYCTTDGSTPTADNLYTGPFWVQEAVTVKATVEGEGYTLSDVAEQQVELKHQADKPVIAVSQQPGAAIVTLTGSTEGADLFYNYSASTDSTKSTKYTGPVTVMKGRTLTAFAASQAYVASEPATQDIAVETPLTFTATLAHMDAAKDPYYDKEYNLQQAGESANTVTDSKVAYYFSWGKTKTAYHYYDTTAEPIGTETDPETGDEIAVYPRNPEEKFDFGNGWAVRSRGQIICNEITIKPGTDLGNTATYNPATVDEFEFQEEYPVTNFYLNISEWDTSNDPRTGMIYTTQKLQGPFAVLSYISNGNAGTGPSVVFETGSDIEGDADDTQWSQVGDTCVLNQGQRLYRKFVRVYTGTDEVYLRTRIANGGSKAGYYDIYVLAIDPASLTGIEEVGRSAATAAKAAAVYRLDGSRLQGMKRGLNIVVENGQARKVIVK